MPENDTEIAAVDVALASLVSTIAAFSYARSLAWVSSEEGTPPLRILNWMLDGVTYSGEEVLDAFETHAMTFDIRTALLLDANISAVGPQTVSLFTNEDQSFWTRGAAVLSPLNIGDEIYPARATQDQSATPTVAVQYDDGSGGIPLVWTTLDLSSLVGANKARVWLAFTTWHPGMLYSTGRLGVREKGDTKNFDQLSSAEPNLQHSGVIQLAGANLHAAMLSCMTDDNGHIELKGHGLGTLYFLGFAYAT